MNAMDFYTRIDLPGFIRSAPFDRLSLRTSKNLKRWFPCELLPQLQIEWSIH